MTDFHYALHRLRKADTLEALDQLERSITRCYDNGVFTQTEYRLLDLKVFEKRIKMENEQ